MAKIENFQVNLEGIIDLLSNHLYSNNTVFLRELLQNAVDAITARSMHDINFKAAIQISYLTGDPTCICFHDNGIGLNEDEITNFLTQIGASSKREGMASRDYLGQFGIGLLSCFMVSDHISMTTQSIKADYALEWIGYADGTYHSRRIAKKEEAGTTVYINLKEEVVEDFSADWVEELLRKYGNLLDIPFFFSKDQEDAIRLNHPDNPLGKNFATHQEEQAALLSFGKEQLGESFLAAIPLNMPSGTTSGVAFVKNRAHLSQSLEDKVYLKGMLLSDKVDNILPKWAFFLKSIINTSKLRPTASRERFYQNEELEQTRKRIGKIVRNQLIEWSKSQAELLQEIIGIHEESIKQMAEEDNDFFKIVLPYLRFPTNKGNLTLEEIRQYDSKIRYIYELETYQQVRSFAAAQDLLIVKTRYSNDMRLLTKVKHLYPEWEIEEIDLSDLFKTLTVLTENEKAQVHKFMEQAPGILNDLGCEIIIRKFEPIHVPTICYLDPAARIDRTSDLDSSNLSSLWMGLHEKLKRVKIEKRATLCLNYDNQSIQEIISLEHPKLLKLYLRLLYFQAVMLANYSLNTKELQLFSQSISEMIHLHKTDSTIPSFSKN